MAVERNYFMAGYREDLPPQRFPDSSIAPSSWSKGQTRIQVPATCCPECGSTHVAIDDNGRCAQTRTWECRACLHRFKLPAGEVVRCYSPT